MLEEVVINIWCGCHSEHSELIQACTIPLPYTTGNLRMCLEWYKVVCSIKVSGVSGLYLKDASESSL